MNANDSSGIRWTSDDLTGVRIAQRLGNTGTTEANNATALTVGSMATLVVGATSIRISMRTATGGASQVATTSLLLPANGRIDWLVEAETKIVYVEAGDAASAYECWVWTSS